MAYIKKDGDPWPYDKVCEELLGQTRMKNETWRVIWEDYQKVPYMYHTNVSKSKWIAYDDQTSVEIKTAFAYESHLAGVMVFSIDQDDFSGKCLGGKYPLLRKINHSFYKLERKDFQEVVKTQTGLEIRNNW